MGDRDEFGIVKGSGNVFRDLGHPDADGEQLRSIIAAQIIAVMDARGINARMAEGISGFAAADFARIRCAKLGRFTIDRLTMLRDSLA